MKKIYLVISLILSTASAHAKPLALVYDGPGACKPGCASAAARVAKKAGFRVIRVNEKLKDYSIFSEAKLWVQPGGKSVIAAQAMGPAMIQQIREFVANGGGYVGFCAGAFLTTSKIGTHDEYGYGILPGSTELLIKEGNDHRMFKVTLADGSSRWMLYAGGPFYHITDEQLKAVDGEVIAHYPDGSIAGIEAHYGKGKVAAVGFHPEAGFFWKILDGKWDPDGSDIAFAISMVKYATTP